MKTRFAEFLLLLIGIISLLGQWQRLSTPLGKVSGHEILLTVLVLFTLFFRANQMAKILQNKWIFLFIGWLSWIAVGTTFQGYWQENNVLWIVGFSYLARLILYFGSALVLSVWYFDSPNIRQYLPKIILIWLIVHLLLGLIQYLLFPDTRWLYYLGWDDHLNRAMGSLLDPGFFGLLMCIGSILAFDRYLEHSSQKRKHWYSLIFAGFILGVALSFSRASYLAYIVGFVIFALLRRQRSILLAIPLLILTLVLIPKDGGGEGQKILRQNSIEARVEVTQIHAQNFQGIDWLIGKGWYYEGALQVHRQALGENREITLSSHARAVDNSFLHVLFSTGVPGFIWFGILLIVVMWKIRYHAIGLSVLVAILTHSLFSTALFYSWIWLVGIALFVPLFICKQPSSNNKKDES